MTSALQRRTLLLAAAACPFHVEAAPRPDHAAWTALLRRHVRLLRGGQASQVDYAGLARDRQPLRNYLAQLSSVTPTDFAGWPAAERMALLINAYNAFTVELVLIRYPQLDSIKDLGHVLQSPWRKRWIPLLGQTLSLDDIEHERLRPVFNDARIHFAVNCASIGCPMLREEAYVAERLAAQLEEQQQRFLSDRTRNRVADGALQVSKLFDWYAADFKPEPAAWLARHAALLANPGVDQAQAAARQLPLRFLGYDWRLNDVRSDAP
jgi:Protein of unknown function, DUF547